MSSLFRQNFTDPARRKATTVSRGDTVHGALEHLRAQARKDEPRHLLFVGSRGIGKSHLLSLIVDEISISKDLSKQLVPVRFPEEANRVLSFADFLLGLVEILKDARPDEAIWSKLYEHYETEESNEIIAEALVPAIYKEAEALGIHFVILMENLNELLTTQLRKTEEQKAFRQFFEQDNRCLLLGTTPISFTGYTAKKGTFYDFFKESLIDHLSEEETIELIRLHLTADNHENLLKNEKLIDEEFFKNELRPKLKAIYRLTAGSPRLSMMLYGLITDESILEIRKQLETLLDRITPFYQDRLKDLSAQERAALETIACMRSGDKTPKAIAAKLRLSQQQTSTLLKRLSQSNYLASGKNPFDGRQSIYWIKEGFFDIWLYMNNSRQGKKRIPFLLDFLALVYPTLEEREEKRSQYREKYGMEADDTLDLLSELGTEEERFTEKIRLAKRTSSSNPELYLQEARGMKLDSMGQWLAQRASINHLDEIEDLIHCWEEHRLGNLENFAAKLSEMANGFTYKNYSETKLSFIENHIEEITELEERAKLRLAAARILIELAHWERAEEHLRKAFEELPEDSKYRSWAMNDLASLLQATNRLGEAEPLMRRALEIDEASFGKDHPNVAIRLNNLASLLQATNRLGDAEPLIRRALEIFERSLGKEHPSSKIVSGNFQILLQEMGKEE